MAPLVVQDEHDIIKLLIVQAVIATGFHITPTENFRCNYYYQCRVC